MLQHHLLAYDIINHYLLHLLKLSMDLTTIFKQYKNKWVVLSDDFQKVIVSDSSAQHAFEKAIKKGEKTPMLFKVPKGNIPYVGVGSHG